jgi:L,D-peptidoglycan transpeptidase YkuD (ErfK/YbiS/YcfS/YnhG family)
VAKVYRLVVTAVVVAAVSLVACALWGVGPLAGAGPLAGPDSAKSVSAARSATDEANSAVPRTAGPTHGSTVDPTDGSTIGPTDGATAGPTVAPRPLPLGPRTTATIPAATTQVLVVSGAALTSNVVAAELYERVDGDWVRITRWKGHIGKKGWTTRHVEGDLKTPVGTFTLSDAGGLLPDPGSDLPYHRSSAFVPPRSEPGFGDAMADAFNYVIAVDYNRVPGRSPLDWTRPLGAKRGGGIWLHVDHDGPTHGCVSLPQSGLRDLLKRLSVERRPVVVMGDAAHLAA